ALSGYVTPHAKIGKPFSTKDEFGAALGTVLEARERLRAEMIARQEEMDWLVYAAYGLLPVDCPACRELPEAELTLAREERPFCLYAAAQGDLGRAAEGIPARWSAA